MIDRHAPCAIRPKPAPERFGTLVRAIIGQQISTKAAASIAARLRERAGATLTPAAIFDVGAEGLRGVGLSRVKVAYVLDLADAVATGRVPLARIGALDDEAIVERLTSVKGIGRWTADMFLIFALGRPDVLPVGDLGVRVALRNHFDLPDLPNPYLCRTLAEPWRPYRTLAMWYLWRMLEVQRAGGRGPGAGASGGQALPSPD
ncbi:MAG TPA: DNA-3-methyladenine glycosylase [Isosphaeraceae bacterium]|jgi:DNA-3-methyladenine glycosylase II|nr:DNA-3-methyladenine glycosylase [Isosphaeraceae bacterium]